jgi:glycerol-3-phosphate acyltransferase PlsY
MDSMLWLSILIPIAYVAGSIPFGLLVGLAKGIDPRRAGSGNIGATNVGRLLGGKYFALVFTLDLLKGLVPMLAAALLLPPGEQTAATFSLWLLVGLAAILGHTFSLFLNFTGGKGVATSTGVILGLFPFYTYPTFVSVITFLAVLKATRYVSLASIVGSAAFSIAYLVFGLLLKWPILGAQLPLLIFAFVMPGLIILRHRANITRLRQGTENKVGETKKAA